MIESSDGQVQMMARQPVPAGLDNALSAIMPQIASLLAGSVGADRCAIFVYDEQRTSAIALYRYGYTEQMLDAHSRADLISPTSVPAEAEVIRTGRPLQRRFPDDLGRWPLTTPGQEQLEGRVCDLVLPLIWDAQVHGVSYVWRSHDPTPFSESEIDKATTVGGMAALAIVFARQYQQERLSRQRLDSLLDVASIATSELGIDEILVHLARAIRSATEADVCSLYVFDSDGTSALVSYQDGVDESERKMILQSHATPVSDIPAEVRARLTFEPQIVRDFANDLAEGTALADFVLNRHVSEILLVPIAFQDSMLGVIYAWYRDAERVFSQAAIDLAEGIASQAGGVVARARLHEETRQQSAESDALLRIGQAMLTSDRLEPVLDEIAESLSQLIPYDYSYVGLLTEDRRDIRVVREWGHTAKPILDMTIPVAKSLSGLAVQTGEVIRTGNVLDDPRAWDNDPKSPPLCSIVVAPLVTDDGTIGTLFIGRRARDSFEPHHERLMSLLSQHAALAIERTRARELQANRAQRNALLTRVVDLLVTSDDPREVLPQIADMACGVIGDGIVIGLSGWQFGSVDWVADSYVEPKGQTVVRSLLAEIGQSDVRDRIENLLQNDHELLIDKDDLGDREYLVPAFEQLDINQVLVVPMFHPERARGLVILLSTSASPRFTREDIELGRIIAHRISDALERQQIKGNEEALLRVSEALHGQSDLSELEGVLVRELGMILPADTLYIGELDSVSRMIYPHVHRVRDEDLVGDFPIPLDSGVVGEAMRTRQPILDNRVEQRGSRIYRNESERRYFVEHGESGLATPLIAEGAVLGALYVGRTGHDRFTGSDLETFLLFAGMAGAALDQATLLQRNRELYRASVEVLAAVVDAKDPMTLEHSRRVAYYSHLIAELLELPSDDVKQIELAGLLHDVGKLGIPDHILRKPSALTEAEFSMITKHPVWGADILSRHPALKDLVPLVRHHHEWFNGAGYPDRRSGADTPLGASIISVADAFDTMTTQRTYQRHRVMDDALHELEHCAGTQFHPDVVEAFALALRADASLMYQS